MRKPNAVMKRPNLTFLALTALTSLSPFLHAYAGGESSGGADYIEDTKAWFQSTNPGATIRACLEVAPGFTIPKSQIKAIITESFQKWDDYIEKTGLKKIFPTQSTTRYSNGEQKEYKGYHIITKLDLQDGCKGGEDLKFLFGIQNDSIIEKKKKYSHPFAFAETNRGTPPGVMVAPWRPGTIWVAPDRSVDPSRQIPLWYAQGFNPFRKLILHEIGHVMGVSHVTGTIMGTRLVRELADETQLSEADKPYKPEGNVPEMEIDQSASLYLGDLVGFEAELATPSWKIEKLFEQMVGRMPVGAVKMKVLRKIAEHKILNTPGGPNPGLLVISLTDSKGTYEIRIEEKMKLIENRNPNAVVFGTVTNYMHLMNYSFLGILKTLSGKEMQVIVNYNLNYSRFEVQDVNRWKEPDVISGRTPNEPLFVSKH